MASGRRLLGSIKGEIAHLQAQGGRAGRPSSGSSSQAQLSQQQAAPATALAPTVPADEFPIQASVAPPSRYGGVVGVAMQYLGTPYVWGGASPSGSTAPAS